MEYRIIKIDVKGIRGHRIDGEAITILNKMADLGWRLVAVAPLIGTRMSFVSSTVAYFYHFERAKQK